MDSYIFQKYFPLFSNSNSKYSSLFLIHFSYNLLYRQGDDYRLPENVASIFFVEFGTSKDMKDATADGKEYEIAQQKVKCRNV